MCYLYDEIQPQCLGENATATNMERVLRFFISKKGFIHFVAGTTFWQLFFSFLFFFVNVVPSKYRRPIYVSRLIVSFTLNFVRFSCTAREKVESFDQRLVTLAFNTTNNRVIVMKWNMY
jgi:hypothetical protein